MYSLDINFLNDRPEYNRDTVARTRQRAVVPVSSRRPLILGVIAALLLPGIALATLVFLQQRNSQLEEQSAALDNQLGDLAAKRKEIDTLRAQATQIREENTALAGIFNQIKPWSAMLQDLRDRTPPNVQVLDVKQIPPGQNTSPQPSPSPSPSAGGAPPQGPISISGLAKGPNDVNDFLLVLQKSNFLKADETRIVKANLQQTAQKLQPLRVGQSTDNNALPDLPKQVEFEIQTALSDVPASDLLRELDRKGAAGLVTRIQTLQNQGVIQK